MTNILDSAKQFVVDNKGNLIAGTVIGTGTGLLTHLLMSRFSPDKGTPAQKRRAKGLRLLASIGAGLAAGGSYMAYNYNSPLQVAAERNEEARDVPAGVGTIGDNIRMAGVGTVKVVPGSYIHKVTGRDTISANDPIYGRLVSTLLSLRPDQQLTPNDMTRGHVASSAARAGNSGYNPSREQEIENYEFSHTVGNKKMQNFREGKDINTDLPKPKNDAQRNILKYIASNNDRSSSIA